MKILQTNERLPNNFELIETESKTGTLKDFLTFLNQSYQEAAVFQISQIQNLIHAQLENFISFQSESARKSIKEIAKHINFHIELQNNKFVILPHNLFTLILVNGEYVDPKVVEPLGRYVTTDYTYIFDTLAHSYYTIPNNLTLHTLDGVQYKTLPAELT